MKKQLDEWKNKYLRALADYQNLEKRTREEKEEIGKFAAEVVLGRLLPAMDSLSKAREHIKDSGLDLTLKEFEAAFAELGVTKLEVVGKQFDPHIMECIEVTQGPDNEVTEELLPGYKYHDKILRVAQVKVGKKHTN